MHFPRSRMHQPSWPYSSASCRLSCSIRHVGIPAGAFHVCRHPSAQSHSPDRDLEPQTTPAPYLRRGSCLSNTSRFRTIRHHARSDGPVCGHAACSLVERPAGMPLNHRTVLTVSQSAQPKAAKSLCQSAGGIWGKLCRLDDFTKRSRSVTGNQQPPLPCQAVLPAVIFRLCPCPLWKAFRQDQAPRSITNFTQN